MPVAVVTGASGGIGLATVKALLASPEQWSVLGIDISAAPKEDLGSNFSFLQVNITEADAPERIVKSAKDKFGALNALINVAGVMDLLQSVDTLDDKLWNRVISINLTAPVKLMGAAVRAFKEQGGGGVIANVASYASISGGAAGVAYTASKHGLVSTAIKTSRCVPIVYLRWTSGTIMTAGFRYSSAQRRLQPSDSRTRV